MPRTLYAVDPPERRPTIFEQFMEQVPVADRHKVVAFPGDMLPESMLKKLEWPIAGEELLALLGIPPSYDLLLRIPGRDYVVKPNQAVTVTGIRKVLFVLQPKEEMS